MADICAWSAIETARRIQTREAGCVEVLQAHLARMEQTHARINAIVDNRAEEALAQARAMDAGPPPDNPPPLWGVPVTIKRNIDMKGAVTSNSVPALDHAPAVEDSPVVANLKAAGAVIFARTATPEFSMRWFTSSPVHGVTKNPWNEALTPGGSSGGAAAALACGVGALAHGNDLGGSLRYPAFCCGVASIRPSLGRIAARNASNPERPPITQLMSVQGPLARSVADLRLGLDVMARFDPRDPLWTPPPAPKARSGRIGFAYAPFGDAIHPALERAMDKALEGLRAAKMALVEVEPPEADRAARVWGDLLMNELRALSLTGVKAHGSAELNRVIEGYMQETAALDLPGFLAALNERIRLQRLWALMFEEYDALIMPTSGAPPFENDLDFKRPNEIPQMLKAQKFLYAINLLGLPSVAVPVDVIDGAPVGVQVVAPMGHDALALDIAEALEREIGRPVTSLQAGI